MNRVPRDIIKEIVETFDPKSYAGVYNLQQLRLVNRPFSVFATSALFRGFETFSLGDCYENMVSRLDTLATSELRHRIRNLDIPRNIIVPRAFQKGIYEDPMSRTAMKKQLYGILDGVTDSCRDQFSRLRQIFGREFGFQEVYITDGVNPFLWRNGLDRAMDVFMDLVSEVLGDPVFSKLTCLEGIFHNNDIELLTLLQRAGSLRTAISGSQSPKPSLLSSAKELKTLTVCLGYENSRNKLEREWGALAHLVETARSVKVLVVKFDGDNRCLPWKYPLSRLEQLFLNNLQIDNLRNFQTCLDNIPNLFIFGLVASRIKISGTNRWAMIFKYLLENKLSLLIVRLEGLYYFHKRFTERDEVIVDDRGSPRVCRRPVFTVHQSDIDAARQLIDTVRARREVYETVKIERGEQPRMFPEILYLEELYSREGVWECRH